MKGLFLESVVKRGSRHATSHPVTQLAVVMLVAIALLGATALTTGLRPASARRSPHSVVALAPTTVTLAPVADAAISSAEPNRTFGQMETLDVYYGGENEISRALIRFNLAAEVPPEAVIDSARLELYLQGSEGADPVTLTSSLLTEEWIESEVTWATRPATGFPSVTDVVDGTPWQYKALDVTQIVQAWHGIPHYGLEVHGPEEAWDQFRCAFESREHGESPPRLVLTYHVPTPTYTLSGRVYTVAVGNESTPLSGVTVKLYGSNDGGVLGTRIDNTTTNAEGWYALNVSGSAEFYHIVEQDPSGYASVGATSVDGEVMHENWIRYAIPLEGKTLTGNRFWDRIVVTGTPTATQPPPATRTLTPIPTMTLPPECQELLANGDFESGSLLPWEHWGQVGLGPGYSSEYAATLGGIDHAEGELWQMIDIPAGANPVRLEFWWLVESDTEQPGDSLEVTAQYDEEADHLRTLGTVAPLGEWQQDAVDLTGYAGRAIAVSFFVHTDDEVPSVFRLDDIQVLACGAPAPTSPPVPTNSATPTGMPPVAHGVFLPVIHKAPPVQLPLLVPGLILGLRHNMNQEVEPSGKYLVFFSAPDDEPVQRMDGGDLGAPNHRGYEWWMIEDDLSADPLMVDPTQLRLPPGLVLGLKHSMNQANQDITVLGNDPHSGPASLPAAGLQKQQGGDLGAPAGQGYYWYETTGEGFSDWSLIERLPKWTIVGLKHSSNQPDKKLNWYGFEYDPAVFFLPSPPGFARKCGGDRNGEAGVGYCWFEKVTGPEVVVKPDLKVQLPRSLFLNPSDPVSEDHDHDLLVDRLEMALADAFRPYVIFDDAESARAYGEPVTLFQARPIGCIASTAGVQPVPPVTRTIKIKWIFLFKRDGGYGPDSWCADDHPGDNDDAFYELESEDGGVTWALTRASLSFKGIEWPMKYRMEVFDVTHPIIYMSASKHHEYFTRDNDHDDSVYSEWGCNDDANGLGDRVLPDLHSVAVEGNNAGEPDSTTTQVVWNQHDVTFDWPLTQRVDLARGTVPITITVWDQDYPHGDEDYVNDLVDLTPGPGRELHLTVDLVSHSVSGNISGSCGAQLTCSGTDFDRAQIWLRVYLHTLSDWSGVLTVLVERVAALDALDGWSDSDMLPADLYAVIETGGASHPSPPFVDDLARYYPGYYAWQADSFYEAGAIKDKWMDHHFRLCD